MMKLGLLKEVEDLLKQKYSWDLPSLSGIGYSQFKGYFEKQFSLDQVIEFLKRDTRRYAKRQVTWFKRDPRIKWRKTYEEAEELAGEFLGAGWFILIKVIASIRRRSNPYRFRVLARLLGCFVARAPRNDRVLC